MAQLRREYICREIEAAGMQRYLAPDAERHKEGVVIALSMMISVEKRVIIVLALRQ